MREHLASHSALAEEVKNPARGRACPATRADVGGRVPMWLACSRFCCYCLAVALISTGELKCRVIMPFTNPRLAYVCTKSITASGQTSPLQSTASSLLPHQISSAPSMAARLAPERDRVVGFVLADRDRLTTGRAHEAGAFRSRHGGDQNRPDLTRGASAARARRCERVTLGGA